MPAPRPPLAILAAAALALAALAVALAAPGAAGPRADAAEGETVTTRLYPGWNMVGWVGPPTPVSEVFDAIPALERVSAWDARAGHYQRASRSTVSAFPALTPGMGLWLFVGGASAIQWTRAVSDEEVLLPLVAGRNLVGWTGEDGAPPADVFADLGGALVRAWWWEASEQRFRQYSPVGAVGGEPIAFNRGSAAWIEVSKPLGWWRPGPAKPPITFLGDVPAETRAELIAKYQDARAFVATRFAAVGKGRQIYVGATADDLRQVHRAVWGTEIDPRPSVCGRTSSTVYVVTLRCASGLSHNYISSLLTEIPGRGRMFSHSPTLDPRGPRWLIWGVHAYVLDAYQTASGEQGYAHERFLDGQYRQARQVAFTLEYFEIAENRLGWVNNSEDALGYLAVERLAKRAGDPAVFDYLRLMRDADDWHGAFDAAFGISVDAFYEQFAAYRAEAFPPFPHLTDDESGPVLAVLEGVPADTAAAIRSEFANVRGFFTDRLKAEAPEFTLYLAPDSAAALEAVRGWHDARTCDPWPLWGLAIVNLQSCGDSPALAYGYAGGILREAVDEQPIPASGVLHGTAPDWFDEGAVAWADTLYGEAAGTLVPDAFRELALTVAVFNPAALRDVSTPDGARAAGDWATKALGFLAVEWLADHAGEPSVFDYYRRLPDAESRDEAFEGAFGLAFKAFYDRFEAYRATLTLP